MEVSSWPSNSHLNYISWFKKHHLSYWVHSQARQSDESNKLIQLSLVAVSENWSLKVRHRLLISHQASQLRSYHQAKRQAIRLTLRIHSLRSNLAHRLSPYSSRKRYSRAKSNKKTYYCSHNHLRILRYSNLKCLRRNWSKRLWHKVSDSKIRWWFLIKVKARRCQVWRNNHLPCLLKHQAQVMWLHNQLR